MNRCTGLAAAVLLAGLFTAQAATVNGTVSDTGVGGAAIVGAIVTLTPIGVAGGTTYRDTTIAAGAYSLTNVAAGTYRISAAAVGYTTSNPALVNVPTAGSTVTQHILLVPLSAGVTISGTVTDSARGTPLAGAVVRLRTAGFPIAQVDSAIVAANGSYTLDSVQAGTYSLNVTAAGHTAQTIARVVVATTNITQNFQLVGLPAGVTVSGTVTDSAAGTPLAGAIVRLQQGGGTIDSAIVAANGSYRLDSVQAGTYSLNVTAAGHTAQTVNGVVVATTNITRNFQLVGLPAGVTISGAVTDSARGTPIAGAIVRLQQGGGTIDSAIVAANGTYTLDSVQAGTYSLDVTAAGYTAQTVNRVVVATTNITRNFQLAALPGVAISGRVADSTSGTPLGGAIVRLFRGAVQIDTALVAANGSYTLSNVPAGTYSVTASAAGYAAKTDAGVVVTNVAVTLNFLMAHPTAVVSGARNSGLARPGFVISANGVLHLNDLSSTAAVAVFTANGRCVYRADIAANAGSVALPGSIARTGGAYLVSITQNGMVYRQQAVIAR